MTTANKVSIFRILLVPFFIVQLIYYVETGRIVHWLLGLVSFVVAALSDALDGYLARRYHQHSELGAVLDPLGDKLLLVVALLFLSQNNAPYFSQIPLWMVVTVLSRDLMVVLGMAIIYFVCGHFSGRPHWSGKAGTVLQMVTVAWTLLKGDEGWLFYMALSAALFTGLSGVIYLREGVHQLSASPSSTPTSPPDRNRGRAS